MTKEIVMKEKLINFADLVGTSIVFAACIAAPVALYFYGVI